MDKVISKEAEGKLKVYFYMEDYIESEQVVKESFSVHHEDLIIGESHPVVNVLNNLGYVLQEEVTHHDVKIFSFVFHGLYSNIHVDVLKWFTENLDVFIEGAFHSDTGGEHEKWGIKGEENVFETVLYMRMPEYQKQLNQQAKELVNRISNIDSIVEPSTVYNVEQIKNLLKKEDNITYEGTRLQDSFMLDLIYTGKITLGFNLNSKDEIEANFKDSQFVNKVKIVDDVFESIINSFGVDTGINIENNERYSNIVEYSGIFDLQTFKPWHLDLLEWLSSHKVGVYLDACDSFEDGILIECAPGSTILTFQRTIDIDLVSAASDYVRVNLLLELFEHVVNETTAESLALMFTEFKDYLEEAGLNINFEHVANIFTPLTLESGYNG